MSEGITLRGACGKELKGKLWRQGGSVKCPGEWSMIVYPRPDLTQLQWDIMRWCEGCDWAYSSEENMYEEASS